MTDSSRITSGAHSKPLDALLSGPEKSPVDGARRLEQIDKQLLSSDMSDENWEQRIRLHGTPVTPLAVPADFSLKRPMEDQHNKPRKRKATAIQVLKRYWDNRAELYQFAPEAQWLHQRIRKPGASTQVMHSPGLPVPDALVSIDVWEQCLQWWLESTPEQRCQRLDAVLKHFQVPDHDSRHGLRGQNGAKSARDIPAYTILGPYVGRYCYGQDLRSEQGRFGVNVGRYAMDCSLDNLRLDLCGYGSGNVTVCINANTTYRSGDPVAQANAEFVLVIYQGWPTVFVMSICDIAKGTEVLVDYGRYYWLGSSASK